MYRLWIDGRQIDFGLIHVFDEEPRQFILCRLELHTLMNWFFPNLSPHPYVILHAGLAQSCRIHNFKKQRKTFSLWRSSPSGLDERGGRKFSSLALTHRLERSPLPRRARVNFWMMDSATPPFGSAQNDRG